MRLRDRLPNYLKMEDITNLKMCYDFFVTKSGSEYQAYNGKTGVLQFYGTNFGTVMNDCIGTFTNTGMIQLDHGEFTMTAAGPAINYNGKSVCIRGAGRGLASIWVKYGTMITVPAGYADYVIKNTNKTEVMMNAEVSDLGIYGASSHTALGGISFTCSWHGVIRNVGITRFRMNVAADGVDAKGIHFGDDSGAALGAYYNVVENVYMTDNTIGINFGLLANACSVNGGSIWGFGDTIIQYGIVEDDSGSVDLYGVDIAQFKHAGSIGLLLKAETFGGSNYRSFGTRFEENHTHLSILNNGGYAKFFGTSFAGTVLHGAITIANGGGYNIFNGCTIDTLAVVTDGCTSSAKSKFVNCAGYNSWPFMYTLPIGTASGNPSDSSTYYIGSIPNQPWASAATLNRVYIPRAGQIRAAALNIQNTVNGSAEDVVCVFRLNNTTDYAFATVSMNAANVLLANYALDIPVIAGDYILLKITTPAWVTNPTGCFIGGSILIECE